ncbi:Lauroyl/myristoyl acyltransferase [Oryzisolibacter propanilivorax]|uniref:Lauroyl/myristoyl acyltransferase n=1 Tax=Oryzisolibacter propanilivorax TaxID=1527607 RepID=A0A1G9S4J4_9BURK|nr:hypothetical protein [Oryzisolibacter propanilivorax]SDM30396.1 Lauroyl/myristoyl acyltransferase [Oryzisolibacter propanilivorax]
MTLAWLEPSHACSRWLQGPEYDGLLPALGWLPRSWALALARGRGHVNAHHDRDWVSLALGHRHVRALTLQALGELLPESQARAALRERYATLAREEFETRLLARRGLAAFEVQARQALDALDARPAGRGLVLLTAHFESFVLGIAALASRGQRVHAVMSAITEDERLHPAVRRHFRHKYSGLERLLNGGRLLPIEQHQRHYYRALQAGDVVVILADAPAPSPEAGVWLPWMGCERAVAQGALRLATATRSLLGGFACHHLGGRRHALALSTLHDAFDPAPLPAEQGIEAAHAAVFAFLEQHIRQAPQRWWGMHLLPHYPSAPRAPMES